MENDKKETQVSGCGDTHHCCKHRCNGHEPVTVKLSNGSIAVPDTRKRIVIPKFSSDSETYMVYTSHDGDKSQVVMRAVSYPKFDNLLTDLGLLNQWILTYYGRYQLSIGAIPKDVKQDPEDVAMVTIKDEARGEETKMIISICVIPNSQNLEESGQHANRKPMTFDLYSFSPKEFYKAFHFILSDFENRLVDKVKKSQKDVNQVKASSTEVSKTSSSTPSKGPEAVEQIYTKEQIAFLLDLFERMKLG